MKNSSHTARILKDSQDICILSSSLPDSISMYFYLKLHTGKQDAFFRDMETLPRLQLTDYGEILESGIGEFPSDASIVKMLQEYGYATPKFDCE